MSAIGQNVRTTLIGRTIAAGAIAGMIAGAGMAMYAMVASATFLGQGFFTPLYGIASPIVGQTAMMTSMKQGLYFNLGPALVGLAGHMMWSAMFGIAFGLIARTAQLRGMMSVVAGVGFGLVIQIVMSLVVLPVLRLGSMPGTIGLPSFTVEHVLFGMMLGLWVVVRPRDVSVVTVHGVHP